MKKWLWISFGIIIFAATVVLFFTRTVSVPQVTQEIIKPELIEILYTDLTLDQARGLIDNNPDLIIIDVSPRYDEGHIPGAVNYYVGDGSLDKAIPTLDKKALYLVYCHFESASRAGAQKLVDAGFTNVYRLEGDYNAWVDAGYDVEY